MDVVCEIIGPRIPTMPGWSTLGFHLPDRQCLHQAPSAAGGREYQNINKTQNDDFRVLSA